MVEVEGAAPRPQWLLGNSFIVVIGKLTYIIYEHNYVNTSFI